MIVYLPRKPAQTLFTQTRMFSEITQSSLWLESASSEVKIFFFPFAAPLTQTQTNTMATGFPCSCERPGVKESSQEPWGCVCGESLVHSQTAVLKVCWSLVMCGKGKHESLVLPGWSIYVINIVLTACPVNHTENPCSSLLFEPLWKW